MHYSVLLGLSVKAAPSYDERLGSEISAILIIFKDWNSSSMGAFGDRLRREREMRGVTLGEISESTKISSRALQALEDEEFGILPGGIFNKGFVRAYARYLGIDEEQAVADYLAATTKEAPAEEEKFPLELTKKPEESRSMLPLVVAVIAVAAILGGWTIWSKYKSQEPEVGGAPTPKASPIEKVAPIPEHPQAASGAAGPSTNAGSASQSASPLPPPKSVDTNPTMREITAASATPVAASLPTTPIGVPSGSPPAGGTPEPAAQPFTVSIKAKEDSWVQIVADGKTVLDDFLGPEQGRSIKANKKLVLRLGNAGGVEVSHNGKSLGILGKESKPLTVVFSPAGLEP